MPVNGRPFLGSAQVRPLPGRQKRQNPCPAGHSVLVHPATVRPKPLLAWIRKTYHFPDELLQGRTVGLGT